MTDDANVVAKDCSQRWKISHYRQRGPKMRRTPGQDHNIGPQTCWIAPGLLILSCHETKGKQVLQCRKVWNANKLLFVLASEQTAILWHA